MVSGPKRIPFAIPGEGPHVISPSLPLPVVPDDTFVDGYSQWQATRGSIQDDPDIRVVLDGAQTAGVGLTLLGDGSRVQGIPFPTKTKRTEAAAGRRPSHRSLDEVRALGGDELSWKKSHTHEMTNEARQAVDDLEALRFGQLVSSSAFGLEGARRVVSSYQGPPYWESTGRIGQSCPLQ